MIYNDGAPQNQDTLKVTMCPRCNNTEFTDNALYCKICGLSLYNRCLGENEDREQHDNPSNARYCEICGSKTVYLFDKVLKEWHDAAINDKACNAGKADDDTDEEADEDALPF